MALVDIYMWGLDRTVADIAQSRAFLSVEEKARADKFVRALDRDRWTVSRAGLRRLLARELGLVPDALVFSQEANGRPKLAGSETISFNLSHSADVAAVAISGDVRVGVDVEEVREIKPAEIEWALSPAERIELAAVDNVPHLETFFRFWTLKEAFMKGTGLGAALPLHDFDMSPAGLRLIRLKDNAAEPGLWKFDEIAPKPGMRAALAARTEGRKLAAVWRWTDFD